MNEELKDMAGNVIELATLVEKLANANDALQAQVQYKPVLDPVKVASALDKCAMAGVIPQKEKDGFAARIAQEPELALFLVEKAATALADRVSPMGSLVGQANRSKVDPYDEAFGA